jgi:hypothetical protein
MIDDGRPGASTDDREFKTETFSNARGWTAVRVTHIPTGECAERARSDGLRSAVQAQRECMDELRAAVTARVVSRGRDGGPARDERDAADLDPLLSEIAYLRHRLDDLEDEVSRMRGGAHPATTDPPVTP